MPSLKDVYAGKFDFGTALPRNAFNDLQLLKLVKAQFNILTPENEMKPDAILDVYGSKKLAEKDETAVAVRFDACKTLLRFAQANGLKVPYVIKPRRPGDIATCYCNPAKAKAELGWEAQYGIEDMCRDSWNWQKNNPNGY